MSTQRSLARAGVLALWLIPLALALIAPAARHVRPAAWLDGQVTDLYFELRGPREASGQFVIVGIDDAAYGELSLAKFHWGWYHAEVIRRLAQGGAQAIALDLFVPPVAKRVVMGTEQELALKELERESFLAMAEAIAEATYSHNCPVFLACLVDDGQLLLPRSELLDATGGGHDHLGLVNLPVGKAADSVVREFVQVLPETGSTGRGLPSLPYLAAHYARTGELVLASEEALPVGPAYINYVGHSGSYEMIPYCDVLLGDAGQLAGRFEGRVVFIGDWGQPEEMFAAPFAERAGTRSMSGVEILANAADTFFLRNNLMPLPGWQLMLAIVIILALSTSAVQLAAPLKSLPVDIVLAAVVAGGGYAAFTGNQLVPVGTLLILLVLNTTIVRAVKLLIIERELRMVTAYFRRNLGPRTLSEIPPARMRELLRGQRYEVAILVAKISEPPGSPEEASPAVVLELVKRCKQVIAAAARDSDGWLHHTTAQAAVVFFGCPVERSDTAGAALNCARLMNAVLEDIDRHGGQDTALLNFGLHYGQVTIGSQRTHGVLGLIAHGQPVDIALRLAALCPEYGEQMLASGEFAGKLTGARMEELRDLDGSLPVGNARVSLHTFTERKPAVINP